MTDRKLRVTLSVAAWCGVFLWALALLASATAVVSANAATVNDAAQISRP